MTLLAVLLAASMILLAACDSKPLPATAPETHSSTAAPQTGAALTAPPFEPAYAGTYTVQDTAAGCALSITVVKQAAGYSFSCGSIQGRAEVAREGSETYFTFVGLKGQEPEEDITAAWQDSVLLIQNYGNSMNEYTRFDDCDAKYLALVRQQ